MNRWENIQAVTFDVGGTLIEPWPSVGHVYSEVAANHGFQVAPELLNHNFAAAWQTRKNFNHTRSDWADLVNRSFASALPGPPSEKLFGEIYERFTSPEVWRICDDVVLALEMLQEREIRLAVISNWDERLRMLLPRLKLESYFESVVISCEVGFAKPSPVIFEYALRKLGLPPSNVLHVGDSFSEDFQGAQHSGMNAVLISRQKRLPDHLIALTDLAGML